MQAKQGDGARRSVCDVLEYLITIPEVKEAIKKDGSKIKLRFAADGRRTSKRIGTVMAVFNILCENKATYEYQYTLALYNGKCIDLTVYTVSFFMRKCVRGLCMICFTEVNDFIVKQWRCVLFPFWAFIFAAQ